MERAQTLRVLKRQDQFRALHEDLRYHALVRQMFHLIEVVEDSIKE